MRHYRVRFLVALVLLAAVVMTSGGTATAAPTVSTISEHDQPAIRPIDRFSGEPDVGQTSPTNLGQPQGQSSLRGESRFDDVLRLAVWLWKARHGLTGF
jgi:hypothetical protein